MEKWSEGLLEPLLNVAWHLIWKIRGDVTQKITREMFYATWRIIFRWNAGENLRDFFLGDPVWIYWEISKKWKQPETVHWTHQENPYENDWKNYWKTLRGVLLRFPVKIPKRISSKSVELLRIFLEEHLKELLEDLLDKSVEELVNIWKKYWNSPWKNFQSYYGKSWR